MPLPSGPSQGKQQAQSSQKGIVLNTEKRIFERAPAGHQPAVLAEISAIQVEEPIRDRAGRPTDKMKMSDKVILSFELEATYQDPESEFFGRRVIITMDAYPTFSNPKQKLYKVCLSWANKKSFSKEEEQMWIGYLTAPMFLENGQRNPDSLVGSPCTLQVIHGTNATTGRDYAAIETVMSPLPGKENLAISADYTPYEDRMRQIEERRAARDNRQSQPAPREKDEFKGQF